MPFSFRYPDHSIFSHNVDLLAELAYRHGAVIAVEDLPRSCLGHDIAELERLVSVNDKLRVCFDTNHLLIDDNLSFAEKLGSKIITIHASDYFFVDECHWLPGEGEVDWHALYNKLVEKGYNFDAEYLVDKKNNTFCQNVIRYVGYVNKLVELEKEKEEDKLNHTIIVSKEEKFSKKH